MDPVKITAHTYNLIATDYSKYYFDYYKENLKHINTFLNYLPKKSKILDAGCASGGISFYLNDKGFEVVGIDLSVNMIKIAKQKVPTVTFQIMDIRDLHFHKNYFQGIVSDYSLIHIPKKDIVKTLKGFYEVLKPNGYIFISVFKGNEEKFIPEPFKPDEKVFWSFFSDKEFRSYLNKSGFHVVSGISQPTRADGEDFLNTEFIYIAKKIN